MILHAARCLARVLSAFWKIFFLISVSIEKVFLTKSASFEIFISGIDGSS